MSAEKRIHSKIESRKCGHASQVKIHNIQAQKKNQTRVRENQTRKQRPENRLVAAMQLDNIFSWLMCLRTVCFVYVTILPRHTRHAGTGRQTIVGNDKCFRFRSSPSFQHIFFLFTFFLLKSSWVHFCSAYSYSFHLCNAMLCPSMKY